MMQQASRIGVVLAFVACAAVSTVAAEPVAAMKVGNPSLESAGPIAFGPDGVLLVADTQAAAIVAIATDDKKAEPKKIAIEGLDAKLAALLGTAADKVRIRDLAVSPVSGTAYLAVARESDSGSEPALIRTTATGGLELVSLDNVKYAKAALTDAPDKDARGRRGRSPRAESITDLAYVDGKVLVAGLSNEEFSSTFRALPYPLESAEKGATIEIFHGAHGRLETNAPVRTFVSFDIEGATQILAAYTCTPLVRIPVKSLKPGEKIRGTTVAELGNRNTPLDMISYKKGGAGYLLMANDRRGVMKIPTAEIGSAPHIDERVGGGGTKGVGYETIDAWKGIIELDRLDAEHALVVHKDDSGALHLETRELP